MLFIFCVGVEAGPNFFSIFFRDGKNYLMLALVMVGTYCLFTAGSIALLKHLRNSPRYYYQPSTSPPWRGCCTG